MVNKFDEASSIALNCYTINKHQFVFSVEFFNHFLKTIFIVLRKIDTFFNLIEIFSLTIRETVHAHIYACYSHMCHSAHICEYDNWKFEDI